MTTELEGRNDALGSALRVAQKNEDRWIGLSPEISVDNEGAEQWSAIAKLRRLEVERIEALLAEVLNSQLTWHDPPVNRHDLPIQHQDRPKAREGEKCSA